jgi:NADH-quinone oxidoreductase subunit A
VRPGYGAILILFIIAGAIGATLHFLASVLGPRAPNPIKAQPFECGNVPTNYPQSQRISVKFYVVALLFVLFDMEAVFLFPWAVIFKDAGWTGFFSIVSFVAVLTLGLVYVWKKGALDWD